MMVERENISKKKWKLNKKIHTTSGAKGLFLRAPPTARGEECRASDRALYDVTRPEGICLRRV